MSLLIKILLLFEEILLIEKTLSSYLTQNPWFSQRNFTWSLIICFKKNFIQKLFNFIFFFHKIYTTKKL